MRVSRTKTAAAGLLLLLVSLFLVIASGTPAEETFDPQRAAGKFPAITEFPVVPAERADRELNDAELVLGVEVNGKARAYPINMLTGPRREILNDTLSGRAIAATW